VAGGHDYVGGKPAGAMRHVSLQLRGLGTGVTATATRLDSEHGNVITEFDRMGRPAWPTPVQIARLRKAAELAPVETVPMDNGRLTLDIPPQGLVLLEIR
jgi:xylan 1,4-beta-xylosidase